ncbi:DNA cytosine methyltransferase [Vibrio alginolyticus]|uniref:DNA cytosine methyltransferase n=1 Tax=Vibrio alginolyticus TaxID=663 RepID=UPI003D114B39|nr:DNA (cytosine-5-)-methyltransferase [Vibrio alginolyticus]
MSKSNRTVLGLFAGIGGLELGLKKSGFKPQMLCELELGAQAVLKDKFTETPLVDDVRNLKAIPKGTTVITAGFPCQDLSSSGQKEGINGKQSFLVDEVFRLLNTSNEVEWVLLENVKFMLHLNKGSAMHYITSKLTSLGFNWAYRVVNSQAFGIPQRRHRVYILASKKHDPRNVLLADEYGVNPNNYSSEDDVPHGFYWTEGRHSTGLNINGIPPLKAGSTIGIPSPPAILFPSGFAGTPDIKDAERLQGFPEDWTKASETVLKPSHRWKLVGNSVSVPVAEWIGRRLISPLEYCFNNDAVHNKSDRWPMSAWCMGGEIYKSSVSEWPLKSTFVGLDRFLIHPLKPLSIRATTGYIKRAEQGNLKHPAGFIDNLKKHMINMS